MTKLQLGNVAGLDVEKANAGIWKQYSGSWEIRIGRIGNTKFKIKLRRLSRSHNASLRTRNPDDAVAEKLLREAMIGTVVTDWRGLKDVDGKDVPFSKDNCMELFTDEQYDEVFDDIFAYANDAENFRAAESKESAKNSKSGSAGS